MSGEADAVRAAETEWSRWVNVAVSPALYAALDGAAEVDAVIRLSLHGVGLAGSAHPAALLRREN